MPLPTISILSVKTIVSSAGTGPKPIDHQCGGCWTCSSFNNLIPKCPALRIVLLEPFIGKLCRREYLEVVCVANLRIGIDINPNGRHWSLLSLRFPHGALAALAADPRITFGLKLRDSSVVCHRAHPQLSRFHLTSNGRTRHALGRRFGEMPHRGRRLGDMVGDNLERKATSIGRPCAERD